MKRAPTIKAGLRILVNRVDLQVLSSSMSRNPSMEAGLMLPQSRA